MEVPYSELAIKALRTMFILHILQALIMLDHQRMNKFEVKEEVVPL